MIIQNESFERSRVVIGVHGIPGTTREIELKVKL